MGGPFRLQPPALADGIVERARLLASLARRWDRRMVTVVAGPGFGKTALLVSAMAGASRRPGDRDVWLACEPADADASVLLSGLGEALGIERCRSLDAVVRAVWSAAPNRVCLVLDDVHEIPPDSDGAALLARVVAELPRNGHVMMASRAPVPVPVARLAARRQLERIVESDLLLDAPELAMFAAVRGVDVAILSSSGGWPAVAELAATAGADLVFEYVWEEVLAAIGEDRAHQLARFAAAGGGDDVMVAAVVPEVVGAEALVAGVPLVERTGDGWVTLHPLWGPVLRRLLADGEADGCRRRAAEVHRDAGRFDTAIGLLVEAQAWDDVIATVRAVEIQPWSRGDGASFGRWYRLLPRTHRQLPAAQFAAAIELTSRLPRDAAPLLAAATAGFRAAGDVDGEMAVIFHDGLIRWWANDVAGLAELYERVTALAAAGSVPAATLMSIGTAAIAHINADSAGVLAALSDIRVDLLDEGWSATVSWFRHVAHRRAGDLDRAELVLDGAMSLTIGGDEQTELAHLHVAWLRGRVDHVRDHFPGLEQRFRALGNRYLHVEVALELAARLAWLGDRHRAQELLDEMTPLLAEMPGALVQILRLIAAAAVAIEDGDDATAAALLAENSHAMPGRADNWYWRDRTALALPYLLEPQWRETWDVETTSPTHRVGIELAGALEAARRGDMATVGALSWPEPGIARAHLPLRWLAELAAAGVAAGNPPDPRLLDALGDSLRPTLQDIVTVGAAPALGPAVAELAARIPALPTQHLTIAVLGPLEVRRDDVVIDHPDLARRRVRELLSLLVARRRIRREVAADVLWPENADPRHNLRVTLNYLQGILEPDRPRSEPSYFLRPAGDTLALVSSERLRCDVWDLVAHLDAADQAERAGDPAAALAAYQAALPLWRGDPYDDIGDLDWVRDEQRQLTSRYTLAALRAGELLLAKQAAHEARGAAEHALKADPAHEPAYQLLVRAHLALDDTRGARRALDACLLVLADLAVEPSGSTVELLSTLTRR